MDPESEVSIQVNDTIHGTNTTSYDISYKLNDNDELVLIVSID